MTLVITTYTMKVVAVLLGAGQTFDSYWVTH